MIIVKKGNVEKKNLSKVDKVKNFFKNKFVIIGIVVFVIVIVTVIVILSLKKENIFSLNEIFSVYPEEVKELYSNMVAVSCYGDLNFGVAVEDGEVSVDKLEKKYLIDYVFSHIDKKYGLSEEQTRSSVDKTVNKLLDGDLELVDLIKDYKYGDYIYNFEGGKLVRKGSKCNADIEYVSFLFGYSTNEVNKILSVDINVGYLKNGILYGLDDSKLGKYDGDINKLRDMFIGAPYYRYKFVASDNYYKLKSVKLNNRIKIEE